MELTNEFTVPLSPERAWSVLTDLARIAPFLPGARLTEVTGDCHKGELDVKVGPIRATYKGAASFVELDSVAKRAVLQAEGRDTRQGRASATVTAKLSPEGSGTRVDIVTYLSVAGKVAQFGRGVLADLSVTRLDQFAECLGAQLTAEPATSVLPEPAGVRPDPPGAPPEDDGSDAASPVPGELADAEVDAAPRADILIGDGRYAAVRPIEPRALEVVVPRPAAGVPVAMRLVPLAVLAAVVGLFLVRRRRR